MHRDTAARKIQRAFRARLMRRNRHDPVTLEEFGSEIPYHRGVKVWGAYQNADSLYRALQRGNWTNSISRQDLTNAQIREIHRRTSLHPRGSPMLQRPSPSPSASSSAASSPGLPRATGFSPSNLEFVAGRSAPRSSPSMAPRRLDSLFQSMSMRNMTTSDLLR